MAKRVTLKEFEDRVNKIYDGSIDVSAFNFVNTQEKGHCKCNKCGHEWDVRGYSLLAGHGCRKCYDKRNSESRKISMDDIQKTIDDQGTGIKIIGEFVDTKHKCLAKCSKCGHEWRTLVSSLTRGVGCPICENLKTSIADFNNHLTDLYGNMYDCSKHGYSGMHKKIVLTCPEHGDFNVLARKIWNQTSPETLCDRCKNGIKEEKIRKQKKEKELKRKVAEEERIRKKEEKEKLRETKIKRHKMTTEEFVARSIQKYGEGTYSYEKTELRGWKDKVIITCPVHGDFEKDPSSFLCGHGCRSCAKRSTVYTTDEWVELAKKKHPEFSYEKVNYVNKSKTVTVTCPVHGDISVIANSFLRRKDPCPKCREDKRRKKNSDRFWKQIEEIYKHRDYTILNRNELINSESKLRIKCNKHENIFYPMVMNVISVHCGCPICSTSRMEESIRTSLLKNKIETDQQKRFNWLRNPKTNKQLPLDFYLPDYNIAIECQGEQHFMKMFYENLGVENPEQHLLDVQYRDYIKRELCKENGVNLIYFLSKNHVQYLHNIENQYFTNKTDLLNYIRTVSKKQ